MDFAISNYRCVWLIECSRARGDHALKPDILCSVFVRMSGVSAKFANKSVSRLPICFRSMATLAARLRRVRRVYFYKPHTIAFCFVGDVISKLSKRPIVQCASLAFFNPSPRAYTKKILNGNSAIRAFSVRYNAFRNYMICVSGKTALFLTSLSKQTLCRLCALGLELFAQSPIPMANFIECSPAVFVAIGIYCNLFNPKINTKKINRVYFFRWRHADSHVQEPFIFSKNQIAFENFELEQLLLFINTNEREPFYSSADRPNTYRGPLNLEIQNPGVVCNAPHRPKCGLTIWICFVCVGDLTYRKAHSLRRQWERFSNRSVKSPLDRNPSEYLTIPAHPRQFVGRTVRDLDRFFKQTCLLFTWNKFDLNGQNHAEIILNALKKPSPFEI